MENNREEQMEALVTLAEFNNKLLKNLPTIINELSGHQQADTDEYLKNIINAIGWEISVMNSTLDVINEGQMRFDKEDFNQKVSVLNSALSVNTYSEIAAALQGIIPCFQQLGSAVKEVIQ